MIKHHIITITDENDIDSVGEYLDALLFASKTNQNDMIHYTFLQLAFNKLSLANLKTLCRERTQLDIMVNGFPRTKKYQLVKPLGVVPIYELRYGISHNEHLRLLFFPIQHKGESYYVFTKAFIKTLEPDVDETDHMRNLSYQMYAEVIKEPTKYLEDDDL
ncbi:hypothetical protein MKX53_19130 [Psychrobacillus sp. FSL K6-4615]|uniref:hypothetical protein n=1 Tax=Psychrobacillus sp. FSL K6-4615 TaxID=2921551 RepID=UPI0030F55645